MRLINKWMLVYLLLLGGLGAISIGAIATILPVMKALIIMGGIISLVGGFVFLEKHMRCPKCHCLYPRQCIPIIYYCPHCGEVID